ncbi:S-methyl-5-thioribose-1-phosphate isomerase [Pelagibacteraceae bacterium]|nr:S-methyl-5-thioribose-1-phosphate isomerase [Pelagibacteraceae bacterium]MDC3156812.1 S-methyl-5-thioribose-1-phosphate isomerase [Pelagibacteraceae bacterium]
MLVNGSNFTTIWIESDNQKVKIIDQRLLPHELSIVTLNTVSEVEFAIREMQVRGAPLIGVTAAFGMYIAATEDSSVEYLNKSADFLLKSRPTAVNLSWAINKIKLEIKDINKEDRSNHILNMAIKIRQDEIDACSNIGDYGLELIKKIYDKKKSKINILTHCNAGWLAAVEWGTALSPIFKANNNKIPIHVWVDETRPRNQGFNLTAWELINENIDCSLVVDNVGGHLMQHNLVDMCIVGTDRTTLSGDVCNKIGTYLKALAAVDNNIPFYVAAPISSIDFNVRNGISDIPIEERDPKEVNHVTGMDENKKISSIKIVPEHSKSVNYAFDVTPSKYVSKLITEKGIIDANEKSIKSLKDI